MIGSLLKTALLCYCSIGAALPSALPMDYNTNVESVFYNVQQGDYYYEGNTSLVNLSNVDLVPLTTQYEVSGFVYNLQNGLVNQFDLFYYNETFTNRYWYFMYQGETIYTLSYNFPNSTSIFDRDTTIHFDYSYNNDQLAQVLYWADFRIGDNTKIDFNNVINPYAVVGLELDYYQIGNYTDGLYEVATGLFYDEQGTYYNKIAISFVDANATRYGSATENNLAPNGTFHYFFMCYYTTDDVQVIVNAQSYVKSTISSQNGASVLINSNYWISSIYQHITIVHLDANSGQSLPSKNQTRLAVLTGLNNLGNSTGVTTSNDAYADTFTLLGSAFNSLVGILGIEVLPGITLGILVFVPLVVTIVLFVVWLVKR